MRVFECFRSFLVLCIPVSAELNAPGNRKTIPYNDIVDKRKKWPKNTENPITPFLYSDTELPFISYFSFH
jgi:hypothetical protein